MGDAAETSKYKFSYYFTHRSKNATGVYLIGKKRGGAISAQILPQPSLLPQNQKSQQVSVYTELVLDRDEDDLSGIEQDMIIFKLEVMDGQTRFVRICEKDRAELAVRFFMKT